jgi:glyoxylase-like metal-dependent hydrolase (beta-lactamase superfamily II)
MERIEIPEEQVQPMDSIADGIYGLRIIFVNVFGISHGNGSWTLIDAGLPFSESYIRNWAEKQFGTPPNALVLTHGHFDHVSAAAGLADHWDIPIYAHFLERPYLTGEKEYPAPNVSAGGGLMTLLSPLLPRGPVNLGKRLRDLQNAGEPFADEMPGWQLIHTPGHTPGHISLFRAEGNVLLPADAFCTTRQESFFEAAMAQKPELHGPPAYFTWNWKLAQQSVERLSRFDPLVIAPGHGKPIAGATVAAALRQLAARFEEIAVPETQREPAA